MEGGNCGIGGKDVHGRMYSEGPEGNVGSDRCKELCARSEWCQASGAPDSGTTCLLFPYTYEDSPCNGKKHDGTYYDDIPGLDGISWNMNQCQKEYKPVDSVFKNTGWRCYLKQKVVSWEHLPNTYGQNGCGGQSQAFTGYGSYPYYNPPGSSKTIDECKLICMEHPDCKAIQVGVNQADRIGACVALDKWETTGCTRTSHTLWDVYVKLQQAYVAGTEGSDSCPGGADAVVEGKCLEAVVSVLPAGATQGRKTLVAGSWGHVPPGCSMQSGGDWAAHYNRQNGNNVGTYTPVCSPEAR